MGTVGRTILIVNFLFAFIAVSPVRAAVHSSEDLFPVYSCLQDNVDFWEKVYSHYSTSQGVIHDKDDLKIIYQVISLENTDTPGAEMKNRKLIRDTKEEYRQILLRLAAGEQPATAREEMVCNLFGSRPDTGRFMQAADNIRYQRGQKDRFHEGLLRSGRYLYEIKEIFRKQGLPEDLVFLPHVESSFNYKAYSKFGAAGIWQFTRSTGSLFLTIDYTLDERRDPILATRAAGRFLAQAYERLGTWPLAITAYNHGIVGMERARDQHKEYPAVFASYAGRTFQFASKNFYPEFLAARKIARNYQHYFGDLAFEKPVAYHEVSLPGYAAIQQLAEYFRVSEDVLRTFNPAVRQPVFEGRKYLPKGYKLRLPEKSKTLAANLPSSLFHQKQLPSRFYQVRPGDTAGKIAQMHKVKLADLILANQLDSKKTVYAGQNLRIPVAGEKIASSPKPSVSEVPVKSKGKIILVQHDTLPVLPPEQRTTDTTIRNAAVQQLTPAKKLAWSAVPELSRRKKTAVTAEVVVGQLSARQVIRRQGEEIGAVTVEVGETLDH